MWTDPTLAARAMLPLAGVVFFVGALVWPILRLWRRTGVFAVTALRTPDPVERRMGLGLVALVCVYVLVTVRYALGGPEAVDATPPGALRVLVVGVAQALGIALVIVAQAQMGRSWRIGIDTTPTALVTTGLYRFIRSPIYAGLLLVLAGVSVIVATPPALLAWPLVATVLSAQARREEAHMAALYPEEFPAWAAKTGRFFPRLG